MTKNIKSAQFDNVFLRLDGTGVTKPTGSGGGVANAQYGAGPWEAFNIVVNTDGTVSIASVAFPGVFLRMDGTGVTEPVGPGGGTVNAQFTAGPWEKFKLVPQGDGTTAFESVAFPGVFLRLDGNGVTQPVGSGGGVANCQFGVGPWEKFTLPDAQ